MGEMERRAGLARIEKDTYRIQSVLPDGFTYWFGGLKKMNIYAAKQVPGNFWTPYWQEGIEDRKDVLESVMEQLFPGDRSVVLLPSHECSFEKAFDLDPDNLTKYILYEEEQRQRNSNPEAN